MEKMEIFTLPQIREALNFPEALDMVLQRVEQAFIRYSAGDAVVPPVGQLQFPELDADVHIKYGYIKGSKSFVVKIASGFPKNKELGLPASDGMILVYDSMTGRLKAILQDEGFLTDLRTAAAGALCSKMLAPKDFGTVGILGTGVQARWQLSLLRKVLPVKQVLVWGRNPKNAEKFSLDMSREDSPVSVAESVDYLAQRCGLVVSATYASAPLLHAENLHPGMHITAMGADSPGKQELDALCFSRADLVAADSMRQCMEYGECSHAAAAGTLPKNTLELGQLLARGYGRNSEEEITIADLTGVAVQDIAVADLVCELLMKK